MRTIADLENIAKEHGWVVTKYTQSVTMLLKKMNKNYADYYEYYCPCKLGRSPQNICPCADADSEIQKTGSCHCKLFYRV